MHRSTLLTAFTLSMNSRSNLKVSTYHGILVSLGNVLHFVMGGGCTVNGFRGRMIVLSELYCGFV